MARHRTVKPSFFGDAKLGRISRDARLTYKGMWVFGDDFGVVPADPMWLKSQIFPYDRLTVPVFKRYLKELEDIHRIFRFMANGEGYYYMPTFLEHQKIDRPNIVDRNPMPPKQVIDSANDLRRFDEVSTMPRSGRDRKGREGKGRESKVKEGRETETVPPELLAMPLFLKDDRFVERYIELTQSWKQTYPHVDIMRELRKAHNYLVEHPEKQYKNMAKYVGNWIARSERFRLEDASRRTMSRDERVKRMRLRKQ